MYYVYILTNKNNTVLYTGVTNNLLRRLEEHKSCLTPNSFTVRYKLFKLVFYESVNDVNVAIAREKQIKSKSREYKKNLIEQVNPTWEDLSLDFQ